MLEDFTLTIIKIEGLGDTSSATCTIELTSSQKLSSPLSTFPISFKIPHHTKLSLSIIHNPTNTKLASLSFTTQLLSCDWFYWLPLFLSNNNFIESLPLTISSPRILLAANKELFKDLSQDTNPSSIKPSTLFPKSPITIQASDLIYHYQQMMRDLELELFQVREICKQKCKNLEKKVEMYKENWECEKRLREEVVEKLLRVKKIAGFVKEDKRKVEDCGGLAAFPVMMEFLTFEDRPLTNLFEETGKYNLDLDGRVKEILKRMKFEGLLRKCRELNYRVGAKTVTLCLKQGEVCCKNGISLEKYLFSSCKTEIENFLRNRKNLKRTQNEAGGLSNIYL